MKEKPIIFGGWAIPKLMDGSKTMTRRPIKIAWDGFSWAGDVLPAREKGWIAWWPKGDAEFTKKVYREGFKCPYEIGQRLWVRETYLQSRMKDEFGALYFKAEHSVKPKHLGGRNTQDLLLYPWKSPRFMPRWVSRIDLEVTGIKPERLQDITEEDAIREGAKNICENDPIAEATWSAIPDFVYLWDKIYPKKPEYQWAQNPFVWAYSFKRIKP